MESLNLEFTYDPCKGDVPNPASNCVDSENAQISGDSQESLADIQLKTEKIAKNAAKINLAKKRLQAYSKQIARAPIKDLKAEAKDKQPEVPPSKKKRDMFHHEKAKAVIKEIEEEKRRELEHNNRRQLLIKNHQPFTDHYLSRDAAEQFKKREIKQRNYRRTDSETKASKSPSPGERRRRGASSSPQAAESCPKSWAEYKSSTERKTSGRSDSKRRPVDETLNDLYSFEANSTSVESFKCSMEKGSKEVPLFYLKRTKATPSIVYSVNYQKVKDGFLTREQLFELIPDKRCQIIRNIVNSHSKLQPLIKKTESRSWYNKIWRKHSDAECKILENSVGLSFLQTYSDEEEENEAEEVLVCSSITNAETKINCDEFEFTLGDEDSGNLTPELPLPANLLENDEAKKHAKKKTDSPPKKKKKKKRKRRADSDGITESSDESKTSRKGKKKTKKRDEKERKRRKTDRSKRAKRSRRSTSSSTTGNDKKKNVQRSESPDNDDSNTPPLTLPESKTESELEPKKPDWENDSLDNNLSKTKPSSSWESDEEVAVREPQERPTHTTRNYDLMDLELEIPLNIKPFKKRDINNFDIDSLSLPRPLDEKNALENEYVEFIKAVTNDVPSIPMPDDVPAPVPHPVNVNLVTAIVPEDAGISTNGASVVAEVVPKDGADVGDAIVVPEEPVITSFNDNSTAGIEFVATPECIETTSSSAGIGFVPEETANSSGIESNSPVTFGFVPEETTSAMVESNTDKIEAKLDENLIDSTETKPLTFASLVLPAKKSLLDNSNLKLDDSDEDVVKKPAEKPEKPREPIVDAKKPAAEKPVEVNKSDKKSDSTKKSKKRERSPRQRSRDSPKRRRRSSRSPERYRDRDLRDRDRDGRRKSTGGRRYPSHRSPVSYSPRRRSPRRSPSPKSRSKRRPSKGDADRKSPSAASPLEGLKRSVADSTIPDESLLPAAILDEYAPSPLGRYYAGAKPEAAKRLSLDERINLELGWGGGKEEAAPISTTYDGYHQYDSNRYHHGGYPQEPDYSTNFVQVGNMVQIVPKDFSEIDRQFHAENKSQIVQVGNVLQIVPADIPMGYPGEASSYADPACQMEGNNLVAVEMKNKMLERRAEKEKRKKEREARRKEKENKRREKEKRRLLKAQQKTENMIMKALQLEVENNDEIGEELNESTTHWPPTLAVTGSKDTTINRSILVRGKQKSSRSKNVQFADGVRPGEGTSPSAGEDFGSPPPSRVLPKEKRYTKTKLRAAGNAKKKVKVKIIKCNTESKTFEEEHYNGEDSDEVEDRSPPPPPPGSPPPHVFPPRLKTAVHPYMLANQNQQVFNSPLNSYVHPMPDSHMQMVHNLGHYQLAAAVPPPPPPSVVASSDLSSYGATRSRTHRYKY
ncbi:unnamed protein product [Phyllotreta striolata]|uniref:Uncharacterized protein n=1 Tax=Phyllotreta striolata TaxID=444603 RepID=A0A9N9XPI9_PHYSR|nr:unnamed protein product [Phyllotreta striolata]